MLRNKMIFVILLMGGIFFSYCAITENFIDIAIGYGFFALLFFAYAYAVVKGE